MRTFKLQLPLSPKVIAELSPGDKVLLSGTLLTARDAAHQRLAKMILSGEKLPFDLAETTLFYCGPSPSAPGKVCGAIGPTTSSRMDKWTPLLIENELRVMIGKGERSIAVQESIRENGGLYLACLGGISAFLAKRVVSCETYIWADLATEGVFRIVVKDFPAFVACK